VFAAPGVSPAQRTVLLGLVDRMVKSSQWKEECEKRDWTQIYMTGDEFGRYVVSEVTRVEAILRGLGLAT